MLVRKDHNGRMSVMSQTPTLEFRGLGLNCSLRGLGCKAWDSESTAQDQGG